MSLSAVMVMGREADEVSPREQLRALRLHHSRAEDERHWSEAPRSQLQAGQEYGRTDASLP